MVRILVADDHFIVRAGLRRVLAVDSGLEVADEAGDGWEVLDKLREGRFDLLLTDMNMPGPHGAELIKRVREEHPGQAVLVLSMHAERQIAAAALRAGAAGYLTKGSTAERILAAVRKVAAGGRYIEPELADKLVFFAVPNSGRLPHECLSPREYQVFTLVAQGVSINDIGDRLALSAKTVSTHKMRIMKKMELDSTADLVRYAMQHGLTL